MSDLFAWMAGPSSRWGTKSGIAADLVWFTSPVVLLGISAWHREVGWAIFGGFMGCTVIALHVFAYHTARQRIEAADRYIDVLEHSGEV